MKKHITVIFLLIFTFPTYSQSKLISLDEMIQIALSRSTSSRIAASVKENKYFQFNSFQIGLRPQLALSGNAADFSHDYLPVIQPDGSIIFQPRLQNYSSLNLSLSKQIVSTGGLIALNSNLVRFDDFDRMQRQYNGIPLNISLNQPLFALNSLKWDKKIQALKYAEAEKEYTHDINNISLQTTNYYFDVIVAQNDFELTKKNLKNQSAILEIELKKISLGTTTRDKILQLKLQMLRSVQELSTADLNHKSAILKLKNYSGIKDTSSLTVQIPLNLPVIRITAEKAISEAIKNRSEIVTFKRKQLEAERSLEQARKDRFKANLVAGIGLNNTAPQFPTIYESPKSQQSFSLGMRLPLLDWDRRKGQISIANSNLKTVSYTNDQDELALKQEIINLVDNIQLIYKNIEVAKETDLIAQERSDLVNEQFKFGKVSVTDLGIALSEKDNAKRALTNALRDFWVSYFQLKVLTASDL